MGTYNQDQSPEYIDLSCYPAQYKVFAKQLERQEHILIEIRDAIVEHNKSHTTKRNKKRQKE